MNASELGPHARRTICARTIQALLGHRSIRTTTRYTRVSVELLKQATALLERLPA